VLRRAVLVVLIGLWAALPAAALDRSAFAFTRYDLHVTVDPHQHGLAVEGSIELRNRSQEPQREAVLQISSSLHWLSILADGEEVEWLQQGYTSDIDHTGALTEAIVKLAKPLAPGAVVRLNVRYSGTVAKDGTRLERIGAPAETALRSDWDEISDNFTALRGVGFVVWYPVSMEAANLERGNELFETLRDWRERNAGSTLRIQVTRAPQADEDGAKFLFVTNSPEAKPAAEITAEYRDAEPVLVLLADPAVTDDRPRVSAYYTTPHTEFARDYMTAAEHVIPDLEPWFGTPHSKVVLVELTDPNALPYDAGAYYFAPMRQVQPGGAEVALARPVVHAMVESPRPWIREGLTAFAQALVREHQSGRRAALAYMGQFSAALQVAEAQSQAQPAAGAKNAQGDGAKSAPDKLPGLTPIAPQPLITTADEVFFRTKAAYVWWMLRDKVGDRTLQAAIAHYRAADDHDTGVMQRLIEAQLGPGHSLEAFFDDWVYRDKGLPLLKLDSLNARRTLGDQTVTAVTMENQGGVMCEVPVAVRSKNGENASRVEIPAHGKAIVRLSLESDPVEIELNDGSVPEAEPHATVTTVTAPPSEKK
jgi:hypothetical protein